MTSGPLLTLIGRVGDCSAEALAVSVESVVEQSRPGWQLVLVDDGSARSEVRERISAMTRHPGVEVVAAPSAEGAAEAWNHGLAAARGTFVGVLEPGDLLAPDTLGEVARTLEGHDDIDVVYTDEDVRDDGGAVTVVAKPDWSPERLRSQEYVQDLCVLRAALVREVGGWRPGFGGAEAHELLLRVTERARRVEHVARVLYHRHARRAAAAGADESGRRAVQEHVDRLGIAGAVEVGGPGWYRTRRVLPPERRVSIVIPTRGGEALVWGRRTTLVCRAVRSALSATRHQNLEVVVVHDTPTPGKVLEELREIAGDRLVLVPFDEPFNYSRKMNLGVLASSGDRLVLLNDDVQVRSEDWVEELLAPLEQPDVGMTGAKLYFSSTAIQHVGLAFCNGRWVHPFHKAPEDTPGPGMALMLDREVSGVTGACVGMRREVYLEIGGFTEGLKESFNDVDFSYKVARAGYRTLLLAHCRLFHFESQTREPVPNPADDRFVRNRWGMPTRDPFIPVFPYQPTWADRNRNLQRRP